MSKEKIEITVNEHGNGWIIYYNSEVAGIARREIGRARALADFRDPIINFSRTVKLSDLREIQEKLSAAIEQVLTTGMVASRP